ncbi:MULTISPECIES: hypothetical protein [unclassified Meridianimarinicoccus]|uniref:hypothetical protein n=1 Tax=unclassified Meridianimarinicoccus TaxID=2923344 RepID=UPI0018665AFE|nr:hypothetical protein [Fluviibacterium sp. MJW13]
MNNVSVFPKTPADKALAILEESWSYYMPAPVRTNEELLRRDARTFEGYYEAA